MADQEFVLPEFNFGAIGQSDPNSFGSSLNRGTDNAQANLFAFMEAMGEKLEVESLENLGRTGRIRNLEEAKQSGVGLAWSDAETFGEHITAGINAVGEGVGSLPSMVGAFGAGTILSGGNPLAGAVAAASVSTADRIGTLQTLAKQRRGEDSELTGGEWLAGLALAPTDMFAAGFLTKPLTKQAISGALKEFGQDATREQIEAGLKKAGVTGAMSKSMAEGVVTGAGVNSLQAAVVDATSRAESGLEINTDEFWDGVKDAAFSGATLGGTLGSAGGYILQKNLRDFVGDSTGVKQHGLIGKGLEKLPAPIRDKSSEMWSLITGRPLDMIERKYGHTEGGKKLVGLFKDTALKNDVNTVHHAKRAEYTNLYQDAVQASIEKYGKKGWEEKLIKDYKEGVTEGPAAMLRDMIGKVGKDSVEAGLLTDANLIKDYLPARMDAKRILDNKEAFVNDLVDSGWTRTPESLQKVNEYFAHLEQGTLEANNSVAIKLNELQGRATDDIMTKIATSDLDSDITLSPDSPIVQRVGNLDFSRFFQGVGQEFYNRWSEGKNEGAAALESINEYVHRAAHRIGGAEVLGSQGQKLNRAIAELNVELDTRGEARMTNTEMDRVYNVVQAYDRVLGRITDPTLRAVSDVGRFLGVITSLPLVVFSSLVEVFNIGMKTDTSTMLKALGTVTARGGYQVARAAFGKRPTAAHLSRKVEAQKGGQTLAQVDDLLANRIDANADVSSLVNKATRLFFRGNGLAHWTQFVRNASSEAARLQIAQDLADVQNFPDFAAGQAAKERLRILGIEEAQYDLARGKFSDQGVDQAARTALIGEALNRFNREVVLEPTFADKPLWMSNQSLWMISQLQSYPTMFTNTVLPMLFGKGVSGVPNQQLDALFLFGGVMLVGAMQQGIRDEIMGRDDRADDDMFWTVLVKNLGTKPVGMVTSATSMVDYGGSSVEAITSPVFGVIDATIEDLKKEGTNPLDLLQNITPFKNLDGLIEQF